MPMRRRIFRWWWGFSCKRPARSLDGWTGGSLMGKEQKAATVVGAGRPTRPQVSPQTSQPALHFTPPHPASQPLRHQQRPQAYTLSRSPPPMQQGKRAQRRRWYNLLSVAPPLSLALPPFRLPSALPTDALPSPQPSPQHLHQPAPAHPQSSATRLGMGKFALAPSRIAEIRQVDTIPFCKSFWTHNVSIRAQQRALT